MSASSAKSKGAKKVKKFFTAKLPVSKRFKSLCSFCETVDVEEATRFFQENEALVLTTTSERFAEVDQSMKKTRHVGSDMIAVLATFRLYLQYTLSGSTNLSAESKRESAILSILERCLSLQNKLELRQLGLDCLMLLIARQPTLSSAILLFSSSLDLDVLQASCNADNSSYSQPGAQKSTESSPLRDTVELWSKMLDSVKSGDKFAFWFELVSKEFLSIFYPQAAIWGASVKTTKHNFAAIGCPPDIQRVLIEKLASWSESLPISGMLWDNSIAPLTMEICRQSCRLPIGYGPSIRTAMEVFRSWLFSDEASRNLLGERLQEYWRLFLQHISAILLLKSSGNDQLKQHTQLCNDVLDIYGYLSFVLEDKLEPESWKVLQETLLTGICDMLGQSSPNAINSMTHLISDELFHSLFLFWLQSPITTPQMWANLRDRLTLLTDWKQLVSQWKEKVMSLTFLIGSWFYQDKTVRKHARDSVFGVQELEFEATSGLPPDHPISTITWTPERLRNVWFIMLNVIGPLARIPSATNYTIAVSCYAEVIDFLLLSQRRLDPFEAPPIPLFEIFLVSLFDMLRLDDRERNRGLLLAYSTLCRLFCRQHIRDMPIQFLSHFYQHIKVGLSPQSHSSVVWVILRYSSDIFALALPGSNILISDYLLAINRLFDADNTIKPPKDVQSKALTVLASLLCFPKKYQGTTVPACGSTPEMKFEEVGELLSSALLKAARYPELHSGKCVPLALSSLACLLWTEVQTDTPRNHVLRDTFQVLLEYSKSKNEAVVEAALDAMSCLAPIQDKINAIDSSLRKLFAATLSNSIITLIERGKAASDKQETAVIAHYNTILEWLICQNSVLIDSRALLDKVLRALEYGLLGQIVEDPDALVATTSEANASADKSKRKTRKKPLQPAVVGEQLSSKALLFDQLQKTPAHGSPKIREAAEVFLLTALTHYNNFPSIAGAEQISSWTSPKDIDESDADLLYFIWHGSTIISMQEIDSPTGRAVVRIVARNYTGKYVWDVSLDYLGPAKNRPKSRMTCLLTGNSSSSTTPPSSTSTPVTSSTTAPSGTVYLGQDDSTLPAFADGIDHSGSDMLLGALKWLEKMHPETQPCETIFFAKPYLPTPLASREIDTARAQLERQFEIEKVYLESLQLKDRQEFPLRPQFSPPKSAIHNCRLFLSHVGFLTPESRQSLHFLDNNARFKRSLKELDKLTGREVMKIGLIFVKPGQEDQRSILANDSRSAKYARFVAGLGWEVNLATHAGFMGGLDRKATTGYSAPYYCDALIEVIFHDITRMPTHADDPQQIHKKRHVGNDIVHIVWSEHTRPYKPSTITSQFNDVHIIIYPLPNELYRISIQQKETIGPFGPLQDGMVISEELLSPLVRMTAINANRVVRKLQELYRKPFPVRAYHIREINERYKVEKSFDAFLGALFPPPIEDVKNRKSIEDLPESARRALRLQAEAAGYE